MNLRRQAWNSAAKAFKRCQCPCHLLCWVQAYPTYVRATGLGICAAMSRFGAILAPYLAVDLARRGHADLAELAIAACCLLAAALVLGLPHETAKQQLQVSSSCTALSTGCLHCHECVGQGLAW